MRLTSYIILLVTIAMLIRGSLSLMPILPLYIFLVIINYNINCIAGGQACTYWALFQVVLFLLPVVGILVMLANGFPLPGMTTPEDKPL